MAYEKSFALMKHKKSSNSMVNRHHLSTDSESGIDAKFKHYIIKVSADKLANFLISRQYSHYRHSRIVLPD
jgi:hypothetical protein